MNRYRGEVQVMWLLAVSWSGSCVSTTSTKSSRPGYYIAAATISALTSRRISSESLRKLDPSDDGKEPVAVMMFGERIAEFFYLAS